MNDNWKKKVEADIAANGYASVAPDDNAIGCDAEGNDMSGNKVKGWVAMADLFVLVDSKGKPHLCSAAVGEGLRILNTGSTGRAALSADIGKVDADRLVEITIALRKDIDRLSREVLSQKEQLHESKERNNEQGQKLDQLNEELKKRPPAGEAVQLMAGGVCQRHTEEIRDMPITEFAEQRAEYACWMCCKEQIEHQHEAA